MFQGIADFFNLIGVDMMWPSLIAVLALIRGALGPFLEYKVEEKKNKDGNKEYKVFKYK